MASSYYPRIVTEGLTLCLDSSNRDSYPATGSLWFNLVGANSGSLMNSPTFASGSNLGTFNFNGTSHHVDLGDNNAGIVAGSSSLSITAWIRPTKFANYDGIVSRSGPSSPFGGWQLNLDSSGRLDLAINISGVWQTYVNKGGTAVTLPANTWSHVAGVYNGTTMSLYLNGRLMGSVSQTGTVSYTTVSNLYIGRNQSSYFGGNISMVNVYSTALSAQDVSTNYNATRSRFDVVVSPGLSNLDRVNLLAYYDFGESTSYSGGSTVYDLSGNDYNATLVNSPTHDAGNRSMTFNGSNQYANVPVSALLNLGSSWTIIAILRFLRLSGSNSVFSTFELSGGALRGYSFGLDYLDAGAYCLGTNNLRTYLGTGQFANHMKISNTGTITTNAWRMVTAVCTGGTSNATVTFYNNATAIGANTWCAGNTSGAINYATSTSSIRIGSTGASGYKVDYANIELGRLLIYNKSMTAAEISTTYTNSQPYYGI